MVTFSPSDSATVSTQPMATDRGFVHDPELRGLHVGLAHSHVCWGAVIAGALTAMALMILSSSFAYACGVPAYSGGDYGWGAGIWSVLTAIIAFFIGGMVVSYFASRSELRIGLLHGIMAWVLAVALVPAVSAFGVLHTYAMNAGMQPTLNQPTWGVEKGAAWGAFLALAFGLVAAALGGCAGLVG